MKLKLFTVLMMGTCLIFLSTVGTYADTSNTNNVNAMMEKQKEIDHAIFEEKKDELDKMGIVVTHTAPLENSVEIGILPYNKENKNYFYEIFGKDNIKVVEGQRAVLLNQTSSNIDSNSVKTLQENVVEQKDNTLLIRVFSVLVLIMGLIFLNKRKLRSR